MTKDERQSLILDLLMQQDSLLVTDLSEQLNVSSVTIRKDLTELEKKKKLYRNHGKAILIDPYSENKNVSEKERLYVEEKRLIGAAAAQLVTPRDSILIASGTTVHALARNIHDRQADRDNGIARSGAHPCQRQQRRHHRTWRNPPPQQFVGGRQICRVGIERLLLQQVVYRCRRHRPRLRHHNNQHDGGKPQPRYDTNRAKDHRARRLIQIRTPRLQQDRRHKRRGPHHHRLAHLSVNGTRHRGDGHRADNCSCPLTSNQAQIIKAIPETIVSGIAFIIPIYTD